MYSVPPRPDDAEGAAQAQASPPEYIPLSPPVTPSTWAGAIPALPAHALPALARHPMHLLVEEGMLFSGDVFAANSATPGSTTTRVGDFASRSSTTTPTSCGRSGVNAGRAGPSSSPRPAPDRPRPRPHPAPHAAGLRAATASWPCHACSTRPRSEKTLVIFYISAYGNTSGGWLNPRRRRRSIGGVCGCRCTTWKVRVRDLHRFSRGSRRPASAARPSTPTRSSPSGDAASLTTVNVKGKLAPPSAALRLERRGRVPA